jgi:hypothetical protein
MYLKFYVVKGVMLMMMMMMIINLKFVCHKGVRSSAVGGGTAVQA